MISNEMFLLKRILLFTAVFILLSFAVQGANVGVVVLLPNSTIYTDCITINDGQTAYDAFQKTNLDMEWTDFGFGYFLQSVEGFSNDDNAGKYWSFWHSNPQGTDFQAAMVGANDYEIQSDDKVIGLSLTAFDLMYNPITSPPFFEYDSLCENAMEISSVKFYVDLDSQSVDEGDTVDAYPNSKIRVVVKIKNLDAEEELSNVELEGVIEGIDGDLEDSDSTDIRKGDKEELELNFDIPLDVDEDKYDMTITITGEGALSYKKVMHYKIDVNKEKHDIRISVPDSDFITCNREWYLDVKLTNPGKNDEDIILKVINTQLGLSYQNSISLDEGDKKTNTVFVKIPADAKGNYIITTNIDYSDISDNYMTSLDVNCDSLIDSNTQTQNTEQQTSNNDKTLKDKSNEYVFVETSTSKSDDVTKVLFLVFANVLLAGFIIFLVWK